MTVFKTFLRLLNHNKVFLILYTAILVFFGVFSIKSNEQMANFESIRPDIYIVNHDAGEKISDALVGYLSKHATLVTLSDQPDALSDALFYGAVSYAIEIPAGFTADFLAGQNPDIAVRSAGNYNASLAEMSLLRFLETAGAYRLVDHTADALVTDVQSTLATDISVELVSHLDTSNLNRASFYYNFLNYPLLAGCIFIICLILLSFRDQKIASRVAISSTPPAKINRILLGSNLLFSLALWLVYVIISFIVVGDIMFTPQGLLLIANSFVFTFCVVTLALLISRLVKSRNAVNSLVNVIGLGTSFLCGAFVPMQWLPDSVRAIAHILPSFWYIDANNQIVMLEHFSWEDLWPILVNITVVIIFSLAFILITNLLSHRRRKE